MILYWLIQTLTIILIIAVLGRLIPNIKHQRTACITAFLASVFVYYSISLWQYWVIWLSLILLFLTTVVGGLVRKCFIGLALLSVVFSGLAGYLFPIFEAENPGGPYDVAYTQHFHDMSDQPMAASYTPDRRVIPVKIWFPSHKPGKSKITLEEAYTGLSAKYRFIPMLSQLLGNLAESHSVATDSTAPIEGPLPMVVYNHGGGGYPEDNHVLMEEIASNGYVVLSVAHPLSTSSIVYPDGAVIDADFDAYGHTELDIEEQIRLNEQYDLAHIASSYSRYYELIKEYIEAPGPSTKKSIDWVEDTISVVQHYAQLPIVGAHIDMNRIVFAGYSFGGAVAIEVCRQNPEFCHSVINIDGLPINSPGIMEADIQKSLLLINANKSPAVDTFSSSQFLAEQNSQPSYNFLIPGATHSQFSSEGYYSYVFNAEYGTSTFYNTQEILGRVVVGFLNKHVKSLPVSNFPEPNTAIQRVF